MNTPGRGRWHTANHAGPEVANDAQIIKRCFKIYLLAWSKYSKQSESINLSHWNSLSGKWVFYFPMFDV